MGTAIYLAKRIIQEVNKKVKRIYWTNEEIDKWFGQRSAREIIRNGTTCFMNPCLDFNLVSSSIISSNEIPHQLIIEEQPPTEEFNFNRLHFILEFDFLKNKYTIDYKRCNQVYVKEGSYKKSKNLVRIVKIDGSKINPSEPLYRSLGYNNLRDLLKDKFQGYSLNENLSRLKKDNSKRNYEAYKKVYGGKFKITEL